MASRNISAARVRAADMLDATRGVVRLSRQVEITLGEFQLSGSQFRILDRLSGGSAAGRNLAEWLAVKPPSITALVDGMVARGLVERASDATDRRRVTHELTEAGHELFAAVSGALAARLAQLVSYVDDEDRAAGMIASLATWSDAIGLASEAKRLANEQARQR